MSDVTNEGAEAPMTWDTAMSRNKQNVMAALAAAGITRVTVRFDGGGDSGQIEEVEAHGVEDPAELPDVQVERIETYAFTFGLSPERQNVTERKMCQMSDAVEAVVYDLLDHFEGGWENNDGGYGEVYFDLSENEIRLEMNARITDIDYSEYSV